MKQESRDLKGKYGYILKLSLLLALCLHLAGFVAKKEFGLHPIMPRIIDRPDTIITVPPPDVPYEPPETPKPPPPVVEAPDDDPEAVETIPELDKLWHRPPPPQIPPPDFSKPMDTPPKATWRVSPEYPTLARMAQLEGTVYVAAYVDTAGMVIRTEVVQSVHAVLDSAAVEAIRQWHFTPAMLMDKPIAVWVAIPVNFTLKE